MLSNQLESLLSKYGIIKKDEQKDKQEFSEKLLRDQTLTQNEDKLESYKCGQKDDDLEEYYDILLNENSQIYKQQTDNSQSIQTLSWKEMIASQTFTPIKPKRNKKEKRQKLQFYNPYYSAQYVENSLLMLQQAKQSLNQENQLSFITVKLGMKNVKSLGVGRCKKQMRKLPFQYTQKLQALIKNE